MILPQLPLYAIAIICGLFSFLVTRLSMPRIIKKLKDADIVGNYVTSWNQTYITNIDLYGVPSETLNGQSSLGFYDACWSAGTTNTSYVAFLGGYSDNGAYDGAFARNFAYGASYASWSRRGRITMNE